MAAIIKKNFRLQNARDFLENLKAHPRVTNGVASPLETSQDLTVTAPATGELLAKATLEWEWEIASTVTNPSSNSQLRVDALRGLKDQIGAHLVDRNHYLFIGKSTPWSDTSNESILSPVNELSPAPALDTLEEERRVWDEMLGLKKITDFSGSLVIPRSDWDGTGKTIYRVFDDKNPNLYGTPNIEEKDLANNTARALTLGNFYVINSEYDLFVCIQTGIGVSGDDSGWPLPSTEEPRRTQSPTALIDYSATDGYIWKYVTTITPSNIAKFATDSWIPVKTLTAQELQDSVNEENAGGLPNPQALVQAAAKPGAVISCIVDNIRTQNNSYTTTHIGKLTNLVQPSAGNDASAKLNVLTPTSTSPSSVLNAYANMHLYVTTPGGLFEVYTIASYDGSNKNIALIPGQTWSEALLATAATDVTYEILPIITVSSNGTEPVKLKPVIENGRISKVRIIDSGKNATYVNVEVNQSSGLNSGSEAAKIRAVLSSTKGLGADIEKDLGAFFVMLNARLSHLDNSGDFPLSNDYRQLGIVRNVRNNDANSSLATATTLNACKKLTVRDLQGNTPYFSVDEIITQSYTVNGVQKTARAKLIEFVDKTNGVYEIGFIQTPETGYVDFAVSDPLASSTFLYTERPTGNQTNCKITVVTDPEVKKFEGEILYLENRRAILRAPEQTEDIKAIIEF